MPPRAAPASSSSSSGKSKAAVAKPRARTVARKNGRTGGAASSRRGKNDTDADTLDANVKYGEFHTRLASFKGHWPHEQPRANHMAGAGFYFDPKEAVDSPDTAICFWCGWRGDSFSPDDEPAYEHYTHEPDCAFARASCLPASLVAIALRTNPRSMPKPYIESDPTTYPQAEEMITARLDTFTARWPHNGKPNWLPTPEKLARAGFFFNPQGEDPTSGIELDEPDDTCTCAYCRTNLDGWVATDNPFMEHKKRNPQCPFFVRIMRPPTKRNAVAANFPQLPPLKRRAAADPTKPGVPQAPAAPPRAAPPPPRAAPPPPPASPPRISPTSSDVSSISSPTKTPEPDNAGSSSVVVAPLLVGAPPPPPALAAVSPPALVAPPPPLTLAAEDEAALDAIARVASSIVDRGLLTAPPPPPGSLANGSSAMVVVAPVLDPPIKNSQQQQEKEQQEQIQPPTRGRSSRRGRATAAVPPRQTRRQSSLALEEAAAESSASYPTSPNQMPVPPSLLATMSDAPPPSDMLPVVVQEPPKSTRRTLRSTSATRGQTAATTAAAAPSTTTSRTTSAPRAARTKAARKLQASAASESGIIPEEAAVVPPAPVPAPNASTAPPPDSPVHTTPPSPSSPPPPPPRRGRPRTKTAAKAPKAAAAPTMPKAAAGVTVPMAAAAVTAPKEAAAAPVASTVPATQPAAPALLPTEPFTPPAMTLAAAPLLSPSAAAATNAATLFPVTPTQPNGNRSTLDEVAARSRPPSATPRRIDPRRLSVSLTPNKSPALQFGLRSSPVIGSTSSALGPPSSSTDLSQSVLRSPTSEKMEVLVSEYVGLRSGKDAAEMKVTTLQMHLKMTEEAHMQGMQQLVSEQLARAAVERRLDEAAAREQQLQQGLAALQARDRAEAESASVDRTALEELQRQVAELQRQIVDHMARETETRARADAASADFDHRQAQARVVLAVIAEQEATGLDRLQNIRAEIETAGNLAAAAQQRLDELQVREKEATRLVETALVHKEAEQHAVRHLEGQVRKLEEQCEAAQARLDSIPRPVAIEKVASPPPPPPPEPRPVTVSMASYYEPSVSAQSQGWLNESECEAIISRFSQEEMDHFRSRAALLTPSELGQCRSMLDFVAMCYSARIVAESGYVDALERVNRARIACPGDVERMHDPLPRVLGDGTMRAAQNVLHYD